MRIRVAHASLQFGDSDKAHTADITKIFDRAVARRYAWITGTEAGPGSGNQGEELIRIGREHGYRVWVPEHQAKGVAARTDCWIAVREDLIKGNWKRGYRHALDGSAQMDREGLPTPEHGGKDRWAPKGVTFVSFDSLPQIGPVSIGAAHYLTDARRPSSPFWEFNERIAKEIGEWAREAGKGKALVFYGGDQNMADNRNNEPQGDTFFGEPMTSTWDELRHWENTGHGNIDVIATYNRDGRVKALDTVALDDREFPLNTDHFFVEATLRVEELKKR